MKRSLVILFLLLIPIAAQAQMSWPKGSLSGPVDVAGLPAAGDSNILWDVRDANSSSDCTAGGGSTRVVCKWNGSAYAVVGGGGGTPTAITVANEATDPTTFPIFCLSATGDCAPKTNSSFTFNSNTGALGVGLLNVTGTGGISFIDATEGIAATGIAGHDILYADSSAHRWKTKDNNGSADTLAKFTDNLSVFATGGAIAPASGNVSGALTVATALNSCADAGANDTYACSLSPAPAGYSTRQIFWFTANTANTGAATVNFNALGAKTIKKLAGGITTDLADNDIRAGQSVEVMYDGTNMQMLSQLGNAPSAAITVGDTQVVFADGANSPAGDAGLVYNKTTDNLTAGKLTTTATSAWLNNPDVSVYSDGTFGFTVKTSLSAPGSITTGRMFYVDGSSNVNLSLNYSGVGAIETTSTGYLAFSDSATQSNTAQNTRLSRNAAGVIQFGTSSNNASGSWMAVGGTLSSATVPITFSNAAYANCTALTTNGSGVLGCTASTEKVKQGLRLFNGGMDAIRRIRPQTFAYRPGTYYADGGQTHLGLIAENLKAANPLLASATGAGVMQPEPMALHAIEISALKELDGAVSQLRSQVSFLLVENARLARVVRDLNRSRQHRRASQR